MSEAKEVCRVRRFKRGAFALICRLILQKSPGHCLKNQCPGSFLTVSVCVSISPPPACGRKHAPGRPTLEKNRKTPCRQSEIATQCSNLHTHRGYTESKEAEKYLLIRGGASCIIPLRYRVNLLCGRSLRLRRPWGAATPCGCLWGLLFFP